MLLDFRPVLDNWNLLAFGFLVTFGVSAAAVAFGFVLAIPLALMKMSGRGWVKASAAIVIETVRNLPFVVLLFVVHFGATAVLFRLPAVWSGFLALSLYGSAYYAEAVRAAFLSVPRGQLESARAIGMSRCLAIGDIIAPQMLPPLLPSATIITIMVIKESAVLSIITVPEVTHAALRIQAQSFATIEAFLVLALIYWSLISLLAHVVRRFERSRPAAQHKTKSRSKLAARYLVLDRLPA